jgi:hypothetical protein
MFTSSGLQTKVNEPARRLSDLLAIPHLLTLHQRSNDLLFGVSFLSRINLSLPEKVEPNTIVDRRPSVNFHLTSHGLVE